ncbi:MAG: hypothetical protein IJS39_15825 [Synergistaceae bacterium]|nr:hypothetical protein [Synergistaceae bacterium]
MAVSSIFHNVILDTPEKVEAFISAMEASEAHPYVRPAGMSPSRKRISPEGYIEYFYEKNSGDKK